MTLSYRVSTLEDMSAHQNYLEAPYDRIDREEIAFERWCDANDVDYDEPDAWERFEAVYYDEVESDPDDERDDAFDIDVDFDYHDC